MKPPLELLRDISIARDAANLLDRRKFNGATLEYGTSVWNGAYAIRLDFYPSAFEGFGHTIEKAIASALKNANDEGFVIVAKSAEAARLRFN